jgi:hypothetical protein
LLSSGLRQGPGRLLSLCEETFEDTMHLTNNNATETAFLRQEKKKREEHYVLLLYHMMPQTLAACFLDTLLLMLITHQFMYAVPQHHKCAGHENLVGAGGLWSVEGATVSRTRWHAPTVQPDARILACFCSQRWFLVLHPPLYHDQRGRIFCRHHSHTHDRGMTICGTR